MIYQLSSQGITATPRNNPLHWINYLIYPLVNWHGNGKSPFLVGDTSSKGPFSIAMLVYRSVTKMTPWSRRYIKKTIILGIHSSKFPGGRTANNHTIPYIESTTRLKTNGWNPKKMEIWKMNFLFKKDKQLRFHSSKFPGVYPYTNLYSKFFHKFTLQRWRRTLLFGSSHDLKVVNHG